MSAIRIPAEWEPHEFCFMSWAIHREWGSYTEKVKRELREIISTVADHEPVRLLVPPDLLADAKQQGFSETVEIIPAPVDDIWMRDILPTYALQNGRLCAIDWNFNGWGSGRVRPARPGDRLAGLLAASLSIPSVPASFIAEGGALATDGQGTVITTKSCLLNPNRNPVFGRTQEDQMHAIEQSLAAYGVRKVVWLEGDSDEPITSGHVDGYVLFAADSRLLVEGNDREDTPEGRRRQIEIDTLRGQLDAKGHKLAVNVVLPPRDRYLRFSNETFAPCYLNAYIANGAVITGRFGDPERDEAACRALQQAFPTRTVIMLRIDHIADGGGGVHCLTKEMPKAVRA
ncbi:agmatine deiminase [Bradyrhizobium diazoefficiens]